MCGQTESQSAVSTLVGTGPADYVARMAEQAKPRDPDKRAADDVAADMARQLAELGEHVDEAQREKEIPGNPFGRITGDPATIHRDPQVVANDLVFEMDHPAAGRLRQPKPLGDFEKTPVSVRRGAPRQGEHGREIAREAGLETAEIEGLIAARVLVEPVGPTDPAAAGSG